MTSPTLAANASFNPTTRRVCDRREQVPTLLQVHQGTGRTNPLAPVSVRTRITGADGRALRDQVMSLTEKDFTNAPQAWPMNICELPAGDTVLTIDASADEQKASRALPYAVR